MSVNGNLTVQIDDAMARLHKTHAHEVIDRAQELETDGALQSANAAIELADKALDTFREALDLLPDVIAARDAKLRGDITLLESGSALMTARHHLETDALGSTSR